MKITSKLSENKSLCGLNEKFNGIKFVKVYINNHEITDYDSFMKVANENNVLNQRINKAIEFVNSMEYCGEEDYFYDLKANDVCGNDNTFNDSKYKLLDILKGSGKDNE